MSRSLWQGRHSRRRSKHDLPQRLGRFDGSSKTSQTRLCGAHYPRRPSCPANRTAHTLGIISGLLAVAKCWQPTSPTSPTAIGASSDQGCSVRQRHRDQKGRPKRRRRLGGRRRNNLTRELSSTVNARPGTWRSSRRSRSRCCPAGHTRLLRTGHSFPRRR